jgi:hypothetical protein
MLSITNERTVRRGARLGKILTSAGLALLIAACVLVLALKNVAYIWVPFLFLLLGVLAASIGMPNMNRWVRVPRADQALEQGLKGLDDRYRLYNYFLPAAHVLLSPAGLFVLTAKGQDGEIHCEGDRCRRKFSAVRLLRLMAEEGLGRPTAEGDAQVHALQQYLDKQGVGDSLEIQNLIVFYNPRANLVTAETSRPVVVPKGLKRAIRRPQEEKLPAAQYRKLQELFDQKASGA